MVPGPEDQQEGQNVLYPPNQPAHLPDIPVPQHHNRPNPLNPPNPPNPPNQPPNQPNPVNPPPNTANPPPNHPNPPKTPPEFSGKAEEDAIMHLLKTNDWMETHNFPDDTKVKEILLNSYRRSKTMV